MSKVAVEATATESRVELEKVLLWPIPVPVTMMSWLPSVASSGTFTVRRVVAVAPAVRLRVLFWKVRPTAPSVDVADRAIFPVKPFMLSTVTVEGAGVPCSIVRVDGLTVRRKLPLFPLLFAIKGRMVKPAA